MMTDSILTETALLTADDLRKWEAEYLGIDDEIAKLERRRKELADKFEAATLLIGRDKVLAVVAPSVMGGTKPGEWAGAKIRAGRETWTRVILDIVREFPGAPTFDEIKEEVRKTSFAERLAQTDKAFYSALSNLTKRKLLVKHKGRIFTPAGYEQFMRDVRDGIVSDEEVRTAARQYPLAAGVSQYFDDHPFGSSTSAAIIAHLKTVPDIAPMVEKGTTQVYNILSRMVKQGRLIKEHGAYRPAPKRNEPPGGTPQGGSEPAPADGS